MELFNRLCGYDGEALERLTDVDQRYLGISSLLSLGGTVLSSLSAFYLLYACTGSFLSSALAAALVFLILYALLVVLISGAALPIFQKGATEQSPTPRWTRLGIFLLISLAFTQPIAVFLLEMSPYSSRVDAKLRQKSAITHQRMQASYESLLKTRERDIALMSETYERLLADKYRDVEAIDQIIPVSEKSGRKALVIGNQNYAFRPLDNPKKDATDLAAALSKMGFEVTLITDVDRVKMQRTIDTYVASLRPKDISVFYFSGHGFEEGNGNYLMPVGMRSESPMEAIGLSINLEKISKRNPLISVAIIDACRDFPFGTIRRGGLKEVNIGPNTYLAMAASPGQRAAEGPPGSNGLFSGSVIRNITRNVDIDRVFRMVRDEVYRKSDSAQLPATFSTLREDFVLAAPRGEKTKDTTPPQKVSMAVMPVTKYRGLSVNPDQVVEPTSQYCGIVGNPDEDAMVRDRMLLCIGEKLLRAQDDMVKLREDIQAYEEDFRKGDDEERKKAMRFMKAYLMLWSDVIFSIGTVALTLLLLAALASGHIMREGFPSAFLRYEKQRQAKQRSRLEKAYVKYRRNWVSALEKFNRRLQKNLPGATPVDAPPFAETAEQDHYNAQAQSAEKPELPGLKALLRALRISKE